MKSLVVSALAVSLSLAAVAQKASGEKQDQILANQESAKEMMDAMMANQQKLMSLNGGDVDLTNESTKMSYAYGVTIGESFRQQGSDDLDYGAFMQGMIASHQQKEGAMSRAEAEQFLNDYMTKELAKKSEAKRKEGQAFLLENGKRKGVVTTESGLQYEELKAGDGPKPTEKSKVTVHYHGTKLNGEVFDSSVERGKPATFGLNQVIRGWTEGVQLMPTGSKYKFYIPSDLAYGDRGAGQNIAPGETLIFEVELISFE